MDRLPTADHLSCDLIVNRQGNRSSPGRRSEQVVIDTVVEHDRRAFTLQNLHSSGFNAAQQLIEVGCGAELAGHVENRLEIGYMLLEARG
jgi:hypothetical protein